MKKEGIIGIAVLVIILSVFFVIFSNKGTIKDNLLAENKGDFINKECKAEAEKFGINSYSECQTKSCYDFCRINRVCCPGYQLDQEIAAKVTEPINSFVVPELLYDVYPKTNGSPVFDFKWVKELKKEGISRAVPYGLWESVGGWEPANRMRFYMIGGKDPIYAVSNGTIVYLDRDKKLISIRYGTDYSYVMSHVINMPLEFRTGLLVKQGDVLGYTEDVKNEGVWDIQVIKRKGSICRTQSPINFFDDSKNKLQFILDSGKWEYPRSTKSWTVNEGSNWITDLGSNEWWASCEKLGLRPGTYNESEADFLKDSPISKILREGYVAVIKV